MVFPFTQNICVTTRTNQVGGDSKILTNPPVCVLVSSCFQAPPQVLVTFWGVKGSWNETSSQTPPDIPQQGGFVYHTSAVDPGMRPCSHPSDLGG